MMNFSLVTLLLFCFASSVFSNFYTMNIQSGADTTLQCTNYTEFPTHMYWFQITKFHARCISMMLTSYGNITFCEGFETKREKYEMRSNVSHIFLTIKNVASSDTGLYYCGEKSEKEKSLIASAVYLDVQEPESKLPVFICIVLGCMIVFLIVLIIVLLNKIRKAHNEEHNPPHRENLDSEGLNYAALHIRPQRRRDRQEESNVIYTSTRLTPENELEQM